MGSNAELPLQRECESYARACWPVDTHQAMPLAAQEPAEAGSVAASPGMTPRLRDACSHIALDTSSN
jgi:hypothetical protein